MDIFLCIIIFGFAIFEAFQYRKQGSDACGVVDIPRFKRNCTADFAGLVTAIIYAIMIEHKISIGAIVPVAAIFGLVAYQAADDEETIDHLQRAKKEDGKISSLSLHGQKPCSEVQCTIANIRLY